MVNYMWYIGYMCEDDIIIYFLVDLNSTYEIVHFDTCLGKAYGTIYKYNKEKVIISNCKVLTNKLQF